MNTKQIIETWSKLIPHNTSALMLWGPTGVGKSAIQKQIVRLLGKDQPQWQHPDAIPGNLEVHGQWGLVDLRISLMEPVDLRGMPKINGKSVEWLPPAELPVMANAEKFPPQGVLFLDELCHAAPAIQNACFGLVLDRCIGPHRLLPGWRITAASNYEYENSESFAMSDPLRTRFDHYHLMPDLEAFKQWGMEILDPAIPAFLSWNPQYLHKPNSNSNESFPTPRGWERVSNIIKVLGHDKYAISAALGNACGGIFLSFLSLTQENRADVLGILKGTVKASKYSINKPDIAWAVTACVTGHVKENKNLMANAIKFYASDVWTDAIEIGRCGLSELRGVDHKRFVTEVSKHMATIHKYYGNLVIETTAEA